MPRKEFFEQEPTNSREAIMQSTFYVLWDEGYDQLTLQRIADRTDLHKSTLYHHFDTREELLKEFLDYLIQNSHEALFVFDAERAPQEAIEQFIKVMIQGETSKVPETETENIHALQTTLFVELRSVAVHNEEFRERFTELDNLLKQHLSSIIQDGIEQGEFKQVSIGAMAETLVALAAGEIVRRGTTMDAASGQALNDVHDLITECLYANNSSSE
ncbi:TetR/AcrR family transcriptional regulator [Halococcus sp. IIIV-5B]|uniref:TetR/AcrR family transcriptional regulator n=1 Tax=Halococcus sp. IIIV-5B TaxID=2321230 RepID=UPI000E75A65D|nr:TetR/AcrR family transcriptional regulator [Halococcus sp. IIIV-5B]RJS99480.1 TetR/AcrR family transcriptional regulator [Halococcus sp. IIIV-5B]